MNELGRILKSFPGLVLILILITVLGAIIFHRIESPHETHSRTHVSKTRQKIFLLAQQLSRKGDQADWSKLVAQVDRYREKLHEAWLAGTDELTIDIPTKWNFWGSVYYCITLFTTIGYGNVSPSTSLGKFITLIYGMLAIPLCSLLISQISTILVRFTKAIHYMILDSSGLPIGLKEAYQRADASYDFRVLPCTLAFIIYLFIGSVVYTYIAVIKQIKWSILDTIYFAFISITTVGFGDLVPDTTNFLAIISIIYIIIGLALTGIIFGRITMAFDQGLSSSNEKPIANDVKTTECATGTLTQTRNMFNTHLKQT